MLSKQPSKKTPSEDLYNSGAYGSKRWIMYDGREEIWQQQRWKGEHVRGTLLIKAAIVDKVKN